MAMIEKIVRWLRRIGYGGGAILLALYMVFCAYSLPRHMKAHVTGIEVTRRDVEGADGRIRTNDIRYVMVEDLDGQAHMFRNQDTGWGWPPYFKFDSGDIAAQAQSYSVANAEDVVLIKYYGFRIRLFSSFANILSMRTVPVNHQPIPWTVIVVLFAHVVVVGGLWIVLRDFSKSRDE